MQLVENWKKWYKMFSVQAMVIAGALQTAWVTLPPDMLSSMNPKFVHGVTIALLVLGTIGRLVKQDKVDA